jgi:hypothetical protein
MALLRNLQFSKNSVGDSQITMKPSPFSPLVIKSVAIAVPRNSCTPYIALDNDDICEVNSCPVLLGLSKSHLNNPLAHSTRPHRLRMTICGHVFLPF